MKKTTQKKILSCQALQGKSIEDIIKSERYQENLNRYMKSQFADREAARASFEAMQKKGLRGMKLPSHPVEHFLSWNDKQFAAEFLRVLAKTSDLPTAKRQYVWQLGLQAYNLTIAQIACDEFPELKKELLPTTNKN